jgi:hypothetical protein
MMSIRINQYSVWVRISLVALVAMLSGVYWNLGWFMALPVIAVLSPILLSLLVCRAFPGQTFRQKLAIYVFAVVIAEIIRNLLYIYYAQGMDYLLHDAETQMAVIALIAGQLLLGSVVIVIAALARVCNS